MARPEHLNATLEQAGGVGALNDKVALVTGGESGIGQGCAIALARAGAKVIVTGRSDQGGSVSQRAAGMLKGRAAETGSETVRLIQDAGGTGEYLKLDVTIEDDWKRVIEHVEKNYGRLDILVNNAGSTGGGALSATDIETLWRMVHLNTEGCFMGITHGWPMLKKSKGVIFNVNTAGLGHGSAGAFAYPCSKHGMFGVTQAAAIDGRPFGIRAISLNPGSTWTGGMARSRKITEEEFLKMTEESSYTPLKRPAYPSDLAAAVVFLSAPQAKHISGISWNVDGGSGAR